MNIETVDYTAKANKKEPLLKLLSVWFDFEGGSPLQRGIWDPDDQLVEGLPLWGGVEECGL